MGGGGAEIWGKEDVRGRAEEEAEEDLGEEDEGDDKEEEEILRGKKEISEGGEYWGRRRSEGGTRRGSRDGAGRRKFGAGSGGGVGVVDNFGQPSRADRGE